VEAFIEWTTIVVAVVESTSDDGVDLFCVFRKDFGGIYVYFDRLNSMRFTESAAYPVSGMRQRRVFCADEAEVSVHDAAVGHVQRPRALRGRHGHHDGGNSLRPLRRGLHCHCHLLLQAEGDYRSDLFLSQ
jgi:hypothetical protein